MSAKVIVMVWAGWGVVGEQSDMIEGILGSGAGGGADNGIAELEA
jgi:hypothetical protein